MRGVSESVTLLSWNGQLCQRWAGVGVWLLEVEGKSARDGAEEVGGRSGRS